MALQLCILLPALALLLALAFAPLYRGHVSCRPPPAPPPPPDCCRVCKNVVYCHPAYRPWSDFT